MIESVKFMRIRILPPGTARRGNCPRAVQGPNSCRSAASAIPWNNIMQVTSVHGPVRFLLFRHLGSGMPGAARDSRAWSKACHLRPGSLLASPTDSLTARDISARAPQIFSSQGSHRASVSLDSRGFRRSHQTTINLREGEHACTGAPPAPENE